MKKVSALLFFCFAVTCLFSAAAYPLDSRGSAAEGKVVDKDGRPVSGVTVVAVLASDDFREGYGKIKAVADATGSFSLQGLYPGTYYRILFEGGQCNDPKDRIRSLPLGETLSLRKDYTLLFSPFKVLSNGVIRDPESGLEWAPVPVPTLSYEMAAAYVQSLGLAGGGWRLPTIGELESLYETAQNGCGLDSAFGNRYPNVWVANIKDCPDRQSFDFLRGEVYTRSRGEAAPCDNCRVLPVRSPLQ